MYQLLAGIGIVLGLPLSAWAFPIDVELQPESAPIAVGTTDLANMAAVMLTNQGAEQLQCLVRFTNGPERPAPRRVMLPADKQVTVTQFFRRHINRVRVLVDCAPQ